MATFATLATVHGPSELYVSRASMPGNGKIIFPPQGASLNSVVAIENFMESTEAVTNLSSAQWMNLLDHIYIYVYTVYYVYVSRSADKLGDLPTLKLNRLRWSFLWDLVDA